MLEFLPKDIRDGLEAARLRDLKKRSRLRLEIQGQSYPILRRWKDGFSIPADTAVHLRGLVDIYDGPRHVFQALIIATSVENGELVCDFKRHSPVSDKPALDFWRDENAPVGYLPSA